MNDAEPSYLSSVSSWLGLVTLLLLMVGWVSVVLFKHRRRRRVVHAQQMYFLLSAAPEPEATQTPMPITVRRRPIWSSCFQRAR